MENNIIYLEEKYNMNEITKIQNHIMKITPEKFSREVIELVWKEDISYFDAINHLMTEKQLEPEYVAKLLNKEVLAELTIELEKTNSIEKSEVNRLF